MLESDSGRVESACSGKEFVGVMAGEERVGRLGRSGLGGASWLHVGKEARFSWKTSSAALCRRKHARENHARQRQPSDLE